MLRPMCRFDEWEYCKLQSVADLEMLRREQQPGVDCLKRSNSCIVMLALNNSWTLELSFPGAVSFMSSSRGFMRTKPESSSSILTCVVRTWTIYKPRMFLSLSAKCTSSVLQANQYRRICLTFSRPLLILSVIVNK